MKCIKSLLIAGLLTVSATAQDLFTLNATTFSPLGAPTGTGMITTDNLFDDILGEDTDFNLFEMSTFVDYTLNYAGIPDFIIYNVTPGAGTVSANLKSPLAGIDTTFTGATRDDVDAQLEEFLLAGGWSKILAAAQANSLVAVTDGTPQSTTALLANQAFDSAGGGKPSGSATAQAGIAALFSADVRKFKAGGFEGESYSFPLSFTVPLGSNLQGNLRIPLAYTKIGDAKAFHAGVHASVPLEVWANPERKQVWTVSPSVGFAGSASKEFVAGSLLWTLGATSNFLWDFDTFYITVGNHLSFYEGIDIKVSGYEVGGEISQQIAKNGVKVSVPFADKKWEAETYVIHTAFLSDAAVESFITPGVQLTRVLPGGARISARVEGDIGDNYDSIGIRFGGGFNF